MEEHRPKKLLDQVRDAIRLTHYAYRTEQAYVGWKNSESARITLVGD